MFNQSTRLLALGLLAACSTACTSTVAGRVVSDVRIANGWISIDRCELGQNFGHEVRIRNCHTENYYLGRAAIPTQTTSAQNKSAN